ncbi:MAG: nuclease-related domain-containing protein [Candidatus Loosdrechtia sp.]|uniref:nuclease-related domain-containing protein n=1 Tax=Candidatus Loosdrechtia sp. TaxID=3101272 RepID=UPI003A60CC4F|nr:MAG: nuclease-related domain-containing protein [Candidatus Jettenia sp. AMX2]
MPRIVSPPVNQLDKLQPPLTEGERLVFNFFHQHLPPEWEIYLQPHLNGLRPDFVLLHPNAGIAVFEVKDWDLDTMKYWVEERPGKPPVLLARKNGEQATIQCKNPVEQIYRYKQELHELYCPGLDQRAGFVVITAGIIFPFARENEVRSLLSPCLHYRRMSQYPQNYPVSGAGSIHTGNINKVFPKYNRQSSRYMNE